MTHINRKATVAAMYPASQEAVESLLAMPIDHEGRSEWRWFVLPNGDIILGFFPSGDRGFVGTEVVRENDYLNAEKSGKYTLIMADWGAVE